MEQLILISKNNSKIIPFLNWAGGKRWLVNNSDVIFPNEYNRYVEPFLGSGAIFFSTPNTPFVLADINLDLIETYQCIKSDWKKIVTLLTFHHKKHSKEYYYKVRASKPADKFQKSANFIYLNRTCWNGLYRVNTKGEFNVPMGNKINVLLETDNFEKISKKLSTGQILCQDFKKTISNCKAGDFLFIDPPYTANHNSNGFLKYNQKIFSWNDQIRLRNAVKDAISRGCFVTMTNANHSSLHELYEGLGKIITLQRNSTIASSGKHRKQTTEMLFTSW